MNKKLLISILTVLIFVLGSGSVQSQISGYTFSSTNSNTYTDLTTGTVVATASGTTGTASLDDEFYTVSGLPFNFVFNNTGYSGFRIYTNGYITFGTTGPVKTITTPISDNTSYPGAISAFGTNLNAFFYSSPASQNGEIRYDVLGTSPNRYVLIQWKNFKLQTQANTPYDKIINLQIRLYETTNSVEFSYKFTGTFTSATAQVGLRGANNTFPTNIANRIVTTGWTASTAGTANTSTCAISSTVIPPSTLVYKYVTPCFAPVNLTANNFTSTTATLNWDANSSGTSKVEYGLSGFTQGTGVIINNATSPLTISNLTPNTNYQFYVTRTCTAGGTSTANLIFKSGALGEDCASATTINIASSLATCSFTTVQSGLNANGPNALCSDATGNIVSNDRWLKFVAPSNGSKVVVTTTAGTVNDWVMEVWSGCPGSGSVVKCSDDVNASMPEISLCQNEYTPGQTYYVRVWTYLPGNTGTMNICAYQATSCIIPPANDECINATRLNIGTVPSCPSGAQTFTTVNATPSAANGTMTGCDISTLYDVWFVFNTGNFGTFNLTFNKLTAGTLHAAIISECGNTSAFLVQCIYTAQGTIAVSGLNPQADYVLRVWSDVGSSGTFSVCLADLCDDPTATISGNAAICTGGTANLSVALTGTPPWSFVYSNGTTNTTVNNVLSSPYTLNVSPTVNTTYTIVSVNSKYCSGTVPQSNAFVSVTTPPTVTFGSIPNVCSNATITLNQGSPSGGTYSGPGVTNGQFSGSTTGVGTFTLTYNYGTLSGCTRSATSTVTVIQAPKINSFIPSFGPVNSQVYVSGSNFTGTNSVKFGSTSSTQFSVVSDNSITAKVPSIAANSVISVTLANSCTASGTSNFVLIPASNVVLNLKLFIQGFYAGGGTMSATFDPVGLPLISDAITVSLALATPPYNIISTQTGMIGTNGMGSFIFPSSLAGTNYYVVIQHRNSVQTWSYSPVFLGANGASYNFTLPRTP